MYYYPIYILCIAFMKITIVLYKFLVCGLEKNYVTKSVKMIAIRAFYRNINVSLWCTIYDFYNLLLRNGTNDD